MTSLQIFAHRGASAYALENTMPAFTKACELGADGVEIDLQRSSDHALFVFHDDELSRLTGVRKMFDQCTAVQIEQLRLGKKFFRLFSKKRIPSFVQFLTWLEENPMPVNIELKASLLKDATALERLLPTLQLPEGSHFSSFHDELLQLVKRIRPDLQTAIIVTKKFNWHDLPMMMHIDAVHAHKKYYKRRYLKAVEYAAVPIRFYSIDGSEAFLSDPHPSVIGIITDYPDVVRKKLQNKNV